MLLRGQTVLFIVLGFGLVLDSADLNTCSGLPDMVSPEERNNFLLGTVNKYRNVFAISEELDRMNQLVWNADLARRAELCYGYESTDECSSNTLTGLIVLEYENIVSPKDVLIAVWNQVMQRAFYFSRTNSTKLDPLTSPDAVAVGCAIMQRIEVVCYVRMADRPNLVVHRGKACQGCPQQQCARGLIDPCGQAYRQTRLCPSPIANIFQRSSAVSSRPILLLYALVLYASFEFVTA